MSAELARPLSGSFELSERLIWASCFLACFAEVSLQLWGSDYLSISRDLSALAVEYRGYCASYKGKDLVRHLQIWWATCRKWPMLSLRCTLELTSSIWIETKATKAGWQSLPLSLVWHLSHWRCPLLQQSFENSCWSLECKCLLFLVHEWWFPTFLGAFSASAPFCLHKSCWSCWGQVSSLDDALVAFEALPLQPFLFVQSQTISCA